MALVNFSAQTILRALILQRWSLLPDHALSDAAAADVLFGSKR